MFYRKIFVAYKLAKNRFYSLRMILGYALKGDDWNIRVFDVIPNQLLPVRNRLVGLIGLENIPEPVVIGKQHYTVEVVAQDSHVACVRKSFRKRRHVRYIQFA